MPHIFSSLLVLFDPEISYLNNPIITPQGKMPMESGDMSNYGRPQSSTSLSPPVSGLVVPQPINARLPNNMLGMNGGAHRKYQCKMCPQVCTPRM